MNEGKSDSFDQWCLVELFGHQKIVGRVREASLAGGAFLRVDVPEHDGAAAFTRFFGPGAIYSLNPVSEEVGLDLLKMYHAPPVTEFAYPKNQFLENNVSEEP